MLLTHAKIFQSLYSLYHVSVAIWQQVSTLFRGIIPNLGYFCRGYAKIVV